MLEMIFFASTRVNRAVCFVSSKKGLAGNEEQVREAEALIKGRASDARYRHVEVRDGACVKPEFDMSVGILLDTEEGAVVIRNDCGWPLKAIQNYQ
jgi:hypothetical protein